MIYSKGNRFDSLETKLWNVVVGRGGEWGTVNGGVLRISGDFRRNSRDAVWPLARRPCSPLAPKAGFPPTLWVSLSLDTHEGASLSTGIQLECEFGALIHTRGQPC